MRVFPPVTLDPSDIESPHIESPHIESLDIESPHIDFAAAATEPAQVVPRVVERPDAHRFELLIGGAVVSFATYSVQPEGAIVVPHVETLFDHRGQGHAAQLMDGMLELLRSSGRRIVPVCPFAAAHVRSEARHHDLLAG